VSEVKDISIQETQKTQKKKTNGKKHGITFTRYFTQPGVHPYSEIQWERRDAVIKSEKGGTVFEQKRVEVPVTWSQTATNITSQHYLRGKLGTPSRETSVKQMVERVAKTIAGWGRTGGYFATEEDAQAFEDELTHLLVNQKMAFNSPVWYNVGVEANPQCSACFILKVEDTMQDIMRLATTEAMVFKYGSGTGVNLSPLRSSKEYLTGGGTASGPVTFMKGWDAFAGVIKSGGKTRRAAKMVILNADHPDIVDFIECKTKEEKKAHVLIDAGYDGRLDGPVYTNIFFQNANNSVRASDEFMKAVENDGDWQTKAVKGGEVLETFKAKELMNKISQAAWECGDPGMQMDTTIQKWNPVSNSDRINATNPCVTGDTLVATSEGYRRIRDLVGKTVNVIDGNGRESLVTEIFPTGRKDIYELKTKSGFTLKLTADHKVFTANRGDVSAKDLTQEDVVLLEKPGFGKEQVPIGMAEMIGAAVGDGCVVESHGQRSMFITLAPEEAEVAEYLNTVLNAQKIMVAVDGRGAQQNNIGSAGTTLRLGTSTPGIVDMLEDYAVLDEFSHQKRFTDRVFGLDKKSQAAALRGLFTTDGTVANYSDKSQYISLDSTSPEMLKQVQLMLLGFGIKAKLYENRRAGKTTSMLPDGKGGMKEYQVREMYSLRISRRGRIIFEKEIGFLLGSKKADTLREINNKVTTYSDDLKDEVKSITYIGAEDVFDLTEPNTNHFVANGMVVHNCSEFVFIDNTSCNLASLNLMKYRKEDGSFDVESYKRALLITITAQEILVSGSSYPIPEITERSRDFRPLGIGYANLGALLMSMGLAYDSDEGRNFAASLTAIMTGVSYAQSARIAAEMGPFKAYKANEKPFLDVMNMHKAHAYMIDSRGVQRDVLEAARHSWDEAYQFGEKHGYKNAQVSVLAPTGTISFLMDCDTTGIEPAIALVSYKWMVGGGMMKLVNRTVPESLTKLGYSSKQKQEILDYIEKTDTIEGAPHLRADHLSVFDCAFKAKNGVRSISWQGHIKMMAAVQPFLSGAISKTVNMPADTTVQDVTDAYMMSWKMGLKAVAIYRDGCKRSQPLTTSMDEKKKVVAAQTMRRKLPDERQSITHKFVVGGHEGFLTVGMYEDGKPGEMFINISKDGSTISGLMGSMALVTSIALQYGVPLKVLVKKFIHMRFEPSGMTNNKDIRFAKSIVDYLFRWMGMKFLTLVEQEEVGLVHEAVEPLGNGGSSGPVQQTKLSLETSHEESIVARPRLESHPNPLATFENQSDAPACSVCGSIMVRNGACYKCLNCGATSGCS